MKRFTDRIRNINSSITLSIIAKAARLRREGKDVISLAAGEPDFNTPDHIVEAGIKAMQSGKTRYTASAGIPELRESIVEKVKRDNGIDCTPQHVIVSAGAKHSLFNLLYVFIENGDEVLIFSPYWVSYPDMVRAVGGKPVFVAGCPENGFVPDLDAIRSSISSRTKMIIVNSPNNPTGVIFPQKFIQDLIEIADQHDLIIVSDECYEKIIYDKPFVSPVTISNPKRVVTMQSMSKTYAMTGWRLGYLVADPSVVQQISKLQSQSTSSINSIAQHASVAALRSSQDFLPPMIEAYRQRRDFLVSRLNCIAGVSCEKPDGAFYCFPNVSALYNEKISGSIELSEFLFEKAKIAVIPGEPFGADDHIRISYATSMENLEIAMNRMEKSLSNIESMKGK